ncbi:MAG: methionyl-tRNA formyltransferase [Rhodospirillales bacterium]
MRIAFMGSPDFSVPLLRALVEAGHDVACVYTQPPRPAGRGQKERPCPVHAAALDLGLEHRCPKTLKEPEAQRAFAELHLDAAVVAAYGLILPKPVLDAPRFGCLNVHASLLPRWRGAAPIQRAIEAGDQKSGVTIMQMEEGLDTGPMLAIEDVPITATTTAESLHDALSDMGARMMVGVLARLPHVEATPQPDEGMTYAKKLDRDEGRIDWSRPADQLDRQVRALNPWPGVWFERGGKRVKLLAARLGAGSGEPGSILTQGAIGCGEGALEPVTVQPEGKKPMDWEAYLRGRPLEAGEVFS